MDTEILIRLGILGLLFCLSAFFSGSETALLSMDPHRVRYLKNEGGKKAEKLAETLGAPEKLLSGILVGNNLVNIALSVIAAGLFAEWFGSKGEIMTILILTPILLIFSEIFPKTMAKQFSEKFSFTVLTPIRLVLFVLTPVIIAIGAITKLMMKIIGAKDDDAAMSEAELQAIITHGSETGALEQQKADMLHGIFELTGTMVNNIAVPRVSVVALDIEATYEDVLNLLETSPHSRFPVYKENMDKIVGVFHAKDFIRCTPEAFKLSEMIREPFFVPETNTIGRLLHVMREKKVHLAIVVDEYGGCDGIVTIEDIIEEIVGEIDDEFDTIPHMKSSENGGMLVPGDAYIKDINRALGCDLQHKEATTVTGLIHAELGSVPEVGQSLTFCADSVKIEVTKMDSHRITEVEVIPLT